MRTAVIALLALTLARCSEEAGPTGWIPSNGVISGVIAPASDLQASARAAPAGAIRARAGVIALALPGRPRPPGPPGIALVAPRMAAGSRSARPARGSRAEFTPNDLIVTFRHNALGAPPVGTAALAAPAAARAVGRAIRAHLAAVTPAGVTVAGVSPAILAAKVRVADTTERDAVAIALRRDPGVAAVTRNRLIWRDETAGPLQATAPPSAAASRTIPNDPFFPFQSWHYGLIDLPRAWSITKGSPAVLVGVVDDGIRFDHPAIAANLTSDGYDFVTAADTLPLCAGGMITNDDDGDGGYDPDPTIPASYSLDATGTCIIPDTLGAHGLGVAGTIGAVGNDGVGVTGVNWTVRIRPVRALGVAGFGETYDIAQAILYAAGLPADDGAGGTVQASSGAAIINLSFGGPGDDPTMHSAIVSAANSGALVVAAAGNDGSSAPFYPAAYPEVLAVAAVGPDGAPPAYSNFGSYVGVRAPGGNFALGDATDGVVSTIWNFFATPGSAATYAFGEGTSFAAPHVSGVAALVLARSPGLTAAALRSRLTSYAVGPATLYGAGLLDAYNSLTERHGPSTQLYARLYSATTGDIVQTVPAQARGRFAFSHVPYGTYLLYGGTDEDGDQQLGIPGRLWGAFGGVAFPESVTVLGAGPSAVSFSIGLPTQLEPNQTAATANVLAIGGYTQGAILDSTAQDMYQVKIAKPGTYTFETSGWVADCGFALEELTAIGLFDSTGRTLLASAGYIDRAHLNFCSRLTRTLNPGTYYVAVAGLLSNRRYRLQARTGT